MAEHTPGPWRVTRRTLGILDITGYVPPNGDPDQVPLGHQFVALVDGLHPVGEANARLIAGSPLLLKCIKVFLAPDDLTARDVGVWMEQARRVVAHLEGEQP